jgi:complement component 1 Q subcomponent-binding protein
MFSIADIQSNQEQEFDDIEKEEGEEADDSVHSYPIRCSFSITKVRVQASLPHSSLAHSSCLFHSQASAPGSLNIDAMCQEGTFIIDNLSFYPSAELGTELTAEADWKRRGLYIGPQFETLDVGVQEEFERFLQERGINEALALFVPEYAEHKEQTVSFG